VVERRSANDDAVRITEGIDREGEREEAVLTRV